MDSAVTGKYKFAKNSVSSKDMIPTKGWAGDEAKGIPGMPPSDHYGNRLIPRDEAAKFMPDIYIDGLADEIQGDVRSMAKHIVPHQFHEFYDESLITEGWLGNRSGGDKSRERTWRANMSLYQVRHPLAEEWQRRLIIGDRAANDRFQDPDDIEYETEILEALKKGDIDRAGEVYKRLADPPKNWEVYAQFIAHFTSRGMLADAVAVYDEMSIFEIPPDGALLLSLTNCAVRAENPLRALWAVSESRKEHQGTPITTDFKAKIGKTATKYLLSVGTPHANSLALRVYSYLKEEGLLERMDSIEDRAQLLVAQAEALGIMPDAEGCGGGHHHRYARTVPPSNGVKEGKGAEVEEGAGGSLSAEEIAQCEALLEAERAADQRPLPYLKKTQPNHLLQKAVFKEYRYEIAALGTSRLPSSRERDLAGKPVDPQMRFAFRWAGPQTRVVNPADSSTVPPTINLA